MPPEIGRPATAGPNFVALSPGSYKPINERIEAVVAYIESIQAAQP